MEGFRAATLQGYREGFRIVFLVMATLAFVSFIAVATLMPHRSVDRSDDTELKEQALKEIGNKASRGRRTAG